MAITDSAWSAWNAVTLPPATGIIDSAWSPWNSVQIGDPPPAGGLTDSTWSTWNTVVIPNIYGFTDGAWSAWNRVTLPAANISPGVYFTQVSGGPRKVLITRTGTDS